MGGIKNQVGSRMEEAGSYVKIPLFVINHAFFGCYVSFREGYRGENKSGFHLFFFETSIGNEVTAGTTEQHTVYKSTHRRIF